MATRPLPEDARVEQLRKRAKDLRRLVHAGDADAIALVAEHRPPAPTHAERVAFPLSAAQLVVARSYGFPSWPRLKRHLDVVERYARRPDEVGVRDGVADEFLRLACLRYGADDPRRWAQARELLAGHPEITHASIHAAAAATDAGAVETLLRGDPAAARREGGPFGWQPLFYLAYARHDPDVAWDAVRATATVLLRHGADPNAGYLWHGLPTPFTVLTGAFGEGEQGAAWTPRHPHAQALARLLLDHGADPNDGQALYNRMFGPDDHLVLLFEYGLGSGDGGPWRARLGDAVDPPDVLLRTQLGWAATHGLPRRVALLVEHGVDFRTPYADGRTPVEMALLAGYRDIADELLRRGATPPALEPADAFVAAVLAGDRAAADRLEAEHPGLVTSVRRARPALVLRAATTGDLAAVNLAAELGFDVNALGRADGVRDDPWETALHHAAYTGDEQLARRLLDLGADPTVRDARFDTTPLDWAHHFGHQGTVALLSP
jgi:ankyrin repeat protein